MFASDAAWSDQDGEFTSDAGAVQVDDISLSHVGHASLEDFEGPGPYVWNALRTSFTGDFADLYPNFTDLDPCRDNDTPVAGFLDYNQIVRNGPGAHGDTSTGGSTYYLYQYGIPGNWVANWLGGLSQGEQYLRNQIWSPPIDLDLPGPEDDDPEFEGLSLSFDVWGHLPFEHGIAFWWMVRSALPGEAWGIWTDLNQAYFSIGDPVWENIQEDLSDLVPAGADRLQVALGVWEFCCLDFVTGATPAPIFDNVTVRKYRLGGPVIAVEEQYLAQDGFPVSGSINPSTPAARDALDVPFSMARDINSSHAAIVAGDSVVCEVEAKIPGTSIADLRMFWALDTHEFFEDALRAAPARPEDQNVVTGPVGTLWTGEVVAGECRASNGTPIPDRYFFDLPDADFMYPGDVLRYYIQATDNDGRVTTMPSDTSDFMNVPNPDGFEGNFFYDRRFVVRALPTFDDGPVPQVQTLAVLATGSDAENDAIIRTFMRAYYLEGQLYDSYTVRAPDYNLSNGIGSAGVHGATAGQLAGYEHIFVFTGDRPRAVLSDGTGYNFNDKGNDIGVLDAWVDLEGPRNLAFFGDHVATGLITDGSHIGAQFVADRMGVLVGDDDVSDVIDNQRSPLVVPYWSFPDAFDADFVVEGGCPAWRDFDQIQPAPGADAGHVFTNYAGVPYAPTGDPAVGGVASVINDYRIATFPFSLGTIPVDEYGRRSSALLGEVMGLFSMPWVACDPYPCTGTTPDRGPAKLSASPNPFNPTTLVKFTAAPGSKGTVKVFNLRGELVSTLHSGEFTKQEFRWEGTDSRGAPVASGVYMIQATDGTVTKTQKVALVK